MTIHPTHTCFDDALDMLGRAVRHNTGSLDSGELKLVHAICVAPDGHEYAHAWVESDEKWVWFQGLVEGSRCEFASPLPSYYEEMNVKETIKYSPREALQANGRHRTYGPWDRRYLALRRQPSVAAVQKKS